MSFVDDSLKRPHLVSALLLLAAANANQPAGLVIGSGSQIVLKRRGALASAADVARVALTSRGPDVIRVGDVAEVRRGTPEPRSAFHAGGRPAIALNIQRQREGNVLETIDAVKALLPSLERRFPSVSFSIPDSQEGLLTLSVANMRDALKSSILMTITVLFLFLASGRSLALGHLALFLLAGFVMLVIAVRQMPLTGQDLLPPMDTGIVKVAFEADSGSSLRATESLLARMEAIIGRTPGVESSLAMIGSEPDVISFGEPRDGPFPFRPHPLRNGPGKDPHAVVTLHFSGVRTKLGVPSQIQPALGFKSMSMT